MRLFIGLPIPSAMATTLACHARTMSLPKARWIAPESFHLTLVFLGEVAEQRLSSIKNELEEVNFSSFPIRLTNLNTFPRASVLIAEVDPINRLLHLQEQIVSRMARSGFAPEERPYHPHITLARFHGSQPRPPRLSESQRALPSLLRRSLSADTINLYRSNLTANGAHYEILAQTKSS